MTISVFGGNSARTPALLIALFLALGYPGAARAEATCTYNNNGVTTVWMTPSNFLGQALVDLNGTENCRFFTNTADAPTMRVTFVDERYGGPYIRSYAYLPGNISESLDNYSINDGATTTNIADSYATLFSITGGPTYTVAGSYTHSDIVYSISVQITYDAAAKRATFSAGTINAAATNTAPVLSAIGNQSGNVGETVSLAVSASDADLDTLSFSATGLPDGLSIDANTGAVTGAPTTENAYTTTITVSDGADTDDETFTWTIGPPLNAAPVLSAIGDQSGNVGETVSLAVSASDVDLDTLSFSATGLPDGLSINASTGAVTGAPTTENAYTTTITVSDGADTDDETFTWTIGPPLNAAPVLSAIGDQSGNVGEAVSLAVSASDADLDTLSFSATGLPDGLSIDAGTGVVTGVPTMENAYTTTITVSDGADTDDETFTWTIGSPLNATPVLSAIGDQAGNVGETVSLAVSASDADLDTLIYSASGLPDGLSINAGTGAVTGAPTMENAYTTTITVSDGADTDDETFTWTIGPLLNEAPVMSAIGDQRTAVGVAATMAIHASDADSDALSFSASGLPPGFSINTQSGVIEGKCMKAGVYSVTISATDGALTASAAFTWTIAERADPFVDPDTVAFFETVNQFAPRLARQTLKPVRDRLKSFLHAPRDSLSNASSQGVRLAYNGADAGLLFLTNSLVQTSGFNQSRDIFKNGWALWTAGEIVFGETDAAADFTVKHITLGVDKRVTPKLATGVALRYGREDATTTNASSIDVATYSATGYVSYVLSEKTHLQGAFGYTHIDLDSQRLAGAETFTGERTGDQFLYSILVGYDVPLNQATLTPYASVEGSYTKLDAYAEQGSINALMFDSQEINELSMSAGLYARYQKKLKKGYLTPSLDIAYQGAIRSDTDVLVGYADIGAFSHRQTFKANAQSTLSIAAGLAYQHQNAFARADYERIEQLGWGHSNAVSVRIGANF